MPSWGQGPRPGPLFSFGSLEPREETKEVSLCSRQCLELVSEPTSALSPYSSCIGAMFEAARKGAAKAQLWMTGRWRRNVTWSICVAHNTCQDDDKFTLGGVWGVLHASLRISPRWASPDGRSGLHAALPAEVASSPPLHHMHTGTCIWVSSTELINWTRNRTPWVSSTELLGQHSNWNTSYLSDRNCEQASMSCSKLASKTHTMTLGVSSMELLS